MIDKEQKQKLFKAMFKNEPKVTDEMFRKFEKVCIFDAISDAEREKLYLEFTKKFQDNSDGSIVGVLSYMIATCPEIARTKLDDHGNTLFHLWVKDRMWNFTMKKNNFVLKTMKANPELFLLENDYGVTPLDFSARMYHRDQNYFHIALSCPKFVKLFNEKCEKMIAEDERKNIFLHDLVLNSLYYDIWSHKNQTEIANVIWKVIEKCPTALKVQDANGKRVLELIEDRCKNKGEDLRNVSRAEKIRASIDSEENKRMFDDFTAQFSPFTPVFLKAERVCPEVMRFVNADGSTMERRLGLDRKKDLSK